MSSSFANKNNHLSKEQDLKRFNLRELLESTKRSAPHSFDEDEELGNVESEAMKVTRKSTLWNVLSLEEQADWNEVAELLECEPSLDILRKKEIQKLAKIKDEEGTSLLLVAVNSEAPLEVVQLLLDADKETQHVYNAGLLTKIIQKYLVPLIRGSFKGDSEADQQLIAQEWMNTYLAKPLVCYVLDASTASSLGKVPTFDGDKIQVPQDVYLYIAKSVTSSKELQYLVNRQSIMQSVLSILFLDLYAHLAVLVLFCFHSDLYLEDIRDFQGGEILDSEIGHENDRHLASGLAILVGYFSGRMLVEMMSAGMFWGYLFDWWTIFELLKLVFLSVTVGLMESGHTSDDPTPGPDKNDFADIRSLMVITSGLLFLSFILFLRNTFLPFSSFVKGTLRVSTQKYLNVLSLWPSNIFVSRS
jgi:hypothetical protein